MASIDFAALQAQLEKQFQRVDFKDLSTWSLAPQVVACVALIVGVLAVVWYVLVTPQREELAAKIAEEATLREQYVDKYKKVVNLEPLKEQKRQTEQYVAQLEKQLPPKSEMDKLLADINQAGVGQNVKFELFRTGTEEVKQYYAILPVTIRIVGDFSNLAGFAADIAALSRIVTLKNISITPKDPLTMTMDATANTYRYLDESEVKKPAAGEGAAK